jgi:hypothetical protein
VTPCDCWKNRLSDEYIASNIKVNIRELGITFDNSFQFNDGDMFLQTSVLTKATRRHISEDGAIHRHSCENLRSYTITNIFGYNAQNYTFCSEFWSSEKFALSLLTLLLMAQMECSGSLS